MGNEDWTITLGDDGTWLCEHMDVEEKPVPPTQLNVAEAQWESPDAPVSSGWSRVRRLQCPDCGTYWRIWEHLRVAKHYTGWTGTRQSLIASPDFVPRYHRAQVRDIDRIIAAVREVFPDVLVTQYCFILPSSDDGLWNLFLREDLSNDISLESPGGHCPFIIETDELSSYAVRRANTVEEAVAMVLDHLKSLR